MPKLIDADKPIPRLPDIFIQARCLGAELCRGDFSTHDGKAVKLMVKLKLRQQVAPSSPRPIPTDGRIEFFVADPELFAGMDAGRIFKILLKPMPTDEEEAEHKRLLETRKKEPAA